MFGAAALAKKVEEDEDFDWNKLDDLLNGLTADEIEELNGDFDPDVSKFLSFFFISIFMFELLFLTIERTLSFPGKK